MPQVGGSDVEAALKHIASEEQLEAFERDIKLDFSYSVSGLARFRVSAIRQRGTISLAVRLVPINVLTIDELDLPQICKSLIMKPRGLILVTGPTSSGKSTTLAAMVDYLNKNYRRHVITIEDPIEYLHHNDKCIIAQMELGSDTNSFESALIQSLRHDPDVIVVGEMRDLPTISVALRAAQTGHLVLGTLHTIDAVGTVNRIIDSYPYGQQQQIALQLSQELEAVLAQTLLPRAKGEGLIAAVEIMIATPAVRNLIREGKTFEVSNIMQLSRKEGMQTMNQVLSDLVHHGIVERDEAMMKSSTPNSLNKLLMGQRSMPRI
jgi:twitching motility protein PilT